MCLLLLALTADDQFNAEGFNQRTFEGACARPVGARSGSAESRPSPHAVRHQDTHVVGAVPACDIDRMPDCRIPLAIVHDAATGAAHAPARA